MCLNVCDRPCTTAAVDGALSITHPAANMLSQHAGAGQVPLCVLLLVAQVITRWMQLLYCTQQKQCDCGVCPL